MGGGGRQRGFFQADKARASESRRLRERRTAHLSICRAYLTQSHESCETVRRLLRRSRGGAFGPGAPVSREGNVRRRSLVPKLVGGKRALVVTI